MYAIRSYYVGDIHRQASERGKLELAGLFLEPAQVFQENQDT